MEGVLWKWTNYWNEVLPSSLLSADTAKMEGPPLKKLATRASETLGRNSNRRRPLHPIQHNSISTTGCESLDQFVMKRKISGWQTRWFVLEEGILSYYKSQEEVSQGSKGSVKVSVCQINVNNIDNTRLDLVIPGQQHMYLKAPSPQDRQKWLVALGSAKACVHSKSDLKVTGFGETNSLNHKMSELRLYCDLMMQQVHEVKSSVTAEGVSDTQKLDDASSLLTSTCDTFIRTLEDIMKQANSTVGIPIDTPLSNIIAKSNYCPNKPPRQSLHKTISQDNR